MVSALTRSAILGPHAAPNTGAVRIGATASSDMLLTPGLGHWPLNMAWRLSVDLWLGMHSVQNKAS